MSITISGTGITLNDGSVITTAIPAVDGIGAIRDAIPGGLASPYPGSNDTVVNTDYGAGTTIAGSGLCVNWTQTGNAMFTAKFYMGAPCGYRRANSSRTSLYILGSGSANNTGQGAGLMSAPFTGQLASGWGGAGVALSYSTLAGSWRSLAPFSLTSFFDTYNSISYAVWPTVLWQRYA